jgi:hypothetical protein
MMMRPRISPATVRRIAIRTVGLADSFIASSRVRCELAWCDSAAKTGTVIGVYMNAPIGYVIITDRGLDVWLGDYHYDVLYSEITQITSPVDDDRELDLMVENDSFDDVRRYSIPVLSVTNRFPDIHLFYDFLMAIMEHHQIIPIDLRKIENLADLVDYLRTECEWEEYTHALANHLETAFSADSLEELKIDKALLDKPEFWRAIAVILNAPIRQPMEKVADPDNWCNTAVFPKGA